MKNLIKIILWPLLGLIVLIGFSLISLQVLLNSPKVVEDIRSKVYAKTGLDLEVEGFSFSPFRHLTLNGPHTSWSAPNGEVSTAQASLIRIKFNLWKLFLKKFSVKEIIIQDLNLTLHHHIPVSKTKIINPKVTSQKQTQNPITKLDQTKDYTSVKSIIQAIDKNLNFSPERIILDKLKQIKNNRPPLKINLQNMQIENGVINFTITEGKNSLQGSLDEVNIKGGLSIEDDEIEGNINIDIGHNIRPNLVKLKWNEVLLEFSPTLKIKSPFLLSDLDSTEPNLSIEMHDTYFKLTHFDFTYQDKGPVHTHIPFLKFDIDFNFNNLETNGFFPFKYTFNSEFSLSPGSQYDLKNKDKEQSLDLDLVLSTDLSGHLPKWSRLIPEGQHHYAFELSSNEIKFSQINLLNQKEDLTLVVPTLKLSYKGELIDGVGKGNFTQNIGKIQLPQLLKKGLSWQGQFTHEYSIPKYLIKAQGNLKLNENQFFRISTNLDLTPLNESLDIKNTIYLEKYLSKIHPSFNFINQTGDLSTQMDLNLKIDRKKEPLSWENWDIRPKIEIKIDQTNPPSDKSNIYALWPDHPIILKSHFNFIPADNDFNFNIQALIKNFQLSPHMLNGPIENGHLSFKGKMQLDPFRLNIDQKGQLNDLTPISAHVQITEKENTLILKSNNKIKLTKKLIKIFPSTKDLPVEQMFNQYGEIGIDSIMTGKLIHQKNNAQEFVKDIKHSFPFKTKGEFKIQSQYSQLSSPLSKENLWIHIAEPITMNLNPSWDGQEMNLSVDMDIPSIHSSLANIDNIDIKTIANWKIGKTQKGSWAPQKGNIKIDSSISSVNIKKGTTQHSNVLNELLQSLKFHLQGDLEKYNDIILNHLSLNLKEGLLELTNEGRYLINRQNGEINGLLKMHIPKKFKGPMDIHMSGDVNAPWKITKMEDRRFELSGHLNLSDLSLHSKRWKIKQIKGIIPFSEKIKWSKSGEVEFDFLIAQNPFERVDYRQVHPLLKDGNKNLFISSIEIDKNPIGPLEADLSIEQNIFKIGQFDLDIDQGRLSGQAYLNAYPSSLELGLLTRITQFDPAPFIANASTRIDRKRKSYLGGRSALIYDFNKSLIKGRIDLNQIGKYQLLNLLTLLDPTYENESISKAKMLLNLAYPTYVGLEMHQGLLNINLDLDMAGVGQSIHLRNIPLSAFLTSFKQNATKTLNKVPLK